MSSAEVLTATDGHRITERERQRGMRINIIAGALAFVWIPVAWGMPITMFFEALGATGVMIGLLSTTRQLAILAQIPSAFYAEQLPARKGFWGFFALIHRVVWFLPALLAFFMPWAPRTIAWVVLIVGALSSVAAHVTVATWYSWMADLIPERTRGRFWATRHSYCIAVHLAAMALFGYILDRLPADGGSFTGFGVVFVIATIAGCVDIVVHLWVPEPKPQRASSGQKALTRVLTPLRDPDFRWVTLSLGVWTFSLWLMSQFTMVYLKRTFDVSYTHLSAMVISASIGAVIFALIFRYIMDRIGFRAFGAIMMTLGPLCTLCWFFVDTGWVSLSLPLAGTVSLPQPVFMLLLVNLLAGGFYNGVALCQVTLTGSLAPREGRIMAMAVHWTVVGLFGAAGPVVGGVIMDWCTANPLPWLLPTGLPWGFVHILVVAHIALCWFVAVPLLLRVRRREREPDVPDALLRLMLGNPLRAVSSAYNIYLASSAASRLERARAVHELGEKRTAIAITDLIAKLDDPSADVREEAALALGKIGSADAVDALVDKLQDPNSDLSPQIARALRQSKDPRSVDALVDKLAEPDRETRTETARTLGEIGDQRAASPLLDLLRHTRDDKVVSASSEALAQLGEMAAIYEILPRMRATRNPVLKRSLAVAVGDLLGERDGFYRILAKEQETHGDAVERLLKRLRRDIRQATPTDLSTHGECLVVKTGELEVAYEDKRASRCADLLFDLAIGLAALKHGICFGEDAKVFVEELLWREQRFGLGAWFLHLLRCGDAGSPPARNEEDMTDILLGVYFLSRVELKN